MILKIERYNTDQECWILDNIKKVSISKKLLKRPTSEQDTEIVLFDLEQKCTCTKTNGACADCQSYMRLICRSTDNTEFCVAFDTIAYLMNDEGKTIEKIVANYNE